MAEVENPCIDCNREVWPRQHAIMCEVCSLWQHRTCNTGVTLVEYRQAVQGALDLNWVCAPCIRQAALEDHRIPAAESTRIGNSFANRVPFFEGDNGFALSDIENSEEGDSLNFCDHCGEIKSSPGDNCCAESEKDMPNTDAPEAAANPTMTDTVTSECDASITDPNTSTKDEFAVDEKLKEQWQKEQMELKKKLIQEDCDDWSVNHITSENEEDFPGKRPLEYIAGVDISFVKGDNVNACAALVVLNFPELEVVYEDLSMVELTAPYIPGYLAFREASFLVEKLEKLKNNEPELYPQVIMVDGNGVLHPRRCGLAVHLGIDSDLPSLGVAKNLFVVPGLEKVAKHIKKKVDKLQKGGDTYPLVTDDGETLGVALKSSNKTTNPVYVSAGHKLSLETAIWLTQQCTKKRVPEPTRWADIKSREYLRVNFLPKDVRQMKGQTKKQKAKNNSDIDAT